MMSMFLTRISCAAWVAIACACGHAAEIPPDTLDAAARPPIGALLAQPGRGDEVVVRGVVRERTGASTYTIADASGRIAARIPDALLTGGIVLSPGTPVEVRGRVVFDPARRELEASSVIILRAAQAPLGADSVLIR